MVLVCPPPPRINLPWGQSLVSLFRAHVGDRRESGRSLVCELVSITHCNTDPEPAKPGSTQEFAGVSPPPGVVHVFAQTRVAHNNKGHLAPDKTSAKTSSSPPPTNRAGPKETVQMPSPMGPTGATPTHRPYSLRGPAAPIPDGYLQSSRRDYSQSFQRVLNPWGC